MNTTATQTPTRVTVNHWQNSRRIEVRPDQVALQVTVPRCSHCPTCQSRVSQFTETLRRKPQVIHEWRGNGDGAAWLFLPRKKGQDPLDLIRKTLEVSVEAY